MHPTTPNSTVEIIGALTEGFDGFSAQLQRAARYIIDQPREVGVQSMRALANKADIHPNTLVRLAQSIGFDGYESMRERFRDFLVSDGFGGFRDRAAWLGELAAKGGSAAVMADMATATSDNLESMWQRQDAAEFDAIADKLLKSDHIYILGVGSAYSLAYQLWYVLRMALDNVSPVPRHGSHPIDDIASIKSNECLLALTFQPYRSETVQAVKRAGQLGATVIGISDSPTSPLAPFCTHLLVSPTHTPQFFQSQAAVTALLEGLVATLVARAGDKAAIRIENFHKERLAAGIYAEPDSLAQLG